MKKLSIYFILLAILLVPVFKIAYGDVPPTPPSPFLPAWGSWAEEITGIKPGERIRPGQYKVPSGQAMKRMTPSEMAGLGGLIDWSAGRAPGSIASSEDYWSKATDMLPRTAPRSTVRWSPSYRY